ncbi:hypothetical protein O6H91_11G012100 [Diphasiastrum complanatum]|uniref:Uncharacterized protein n=1 Tax=Diphasiastrum complanatum TaxID=34168 RepID=A0ACC2C6A8_DIPCM|nr:hypothetical protein O6H91_11G012100 [Diphasiastrum complanatum]
MRKHPSAQVVAAGGSRYPAQATGRGARAVAEVGAPNGRGAGRAPAPRPPAAAGGGGGGGGPAPPPGAAGGPPPAGGAGRTRDWRRDAALPGAPDAFETGAGTPCSQGALGCARGAGRVRVWRRDTLLGKHHVPERSEAPGWTRGRAQFACRRTLRDWHRNGFWKSRVAKSYGERQLANAARRRHSGKHRKPARVAMIYNFAQIIASKKRRSCDMSWGRWKRKVVEGAAPGLPGRSPIPVLFRPKHA